jgi:hypothetical protein
MKKILLLVFLFPIIALPYDMNMGAWEVLDRGAVYTENSDGCTAPIIPSVRISDTIFDTIKYQHGATWNDADSFSVDSVADESGDTAWTIEKMDGDSIAVIIRHTFTPILVYWTVRYCDLLSLSGVDTIDVVVDSVKLDTVINADLSIVDTCYYYDTILFVGHIPDDAVPENITLNGDTIDTIYWHKGDRDTIAVAIPVTLDTGQVLPILADTISADTANSFYVAGPYDTVTITVNPHDTTVSNGQTVIFHIDATSSGTIIYQWQANAGGGWGDLGGETNDTLTWAVVTAENGYLYRCIVTDPRGADTSTTATLTVSETVYTVTVTDAGNGSTDPIGGQAVADGYSIQVIAVPDAHYHFLRWTRSTIDVVPTDSSNDTTMVTANGNGTMTAVFGIDSSEVTIGTAANGTITSPCPDQIFAYGETDTVIFTPATGYRVVGATDKLPDTSIFQPTADTTVDTAFELFPTYAIDTTKVGLGTWTIAGGLTRDSGAIITYVASPTAGWAFARYGGTFTGTSATDSFVISGNHIDSLILSIVPIIDTRRDLNRISCARRLDTVTFITATDIYDSTDQSAVFIGRDTTGSMTITRWFNSGSGLDSIWAIVPADATANKNFRPILRNGYGICSNVRTPVTWREPWILNVKVMVP